MNNEKFEQLRLNFLPRFWDTVNKVMIYPENKFDDFGEIEDIAYFINDYTYYSFIDLLYNDNLIMMKPTSLKDKNGKLIYEGDIVKGKSWGAYHKTVVEYIPCYGGYIPFTQTPVEKALCFDDLKDIEIIGNIYENKE